MSVEAIVTWDTFAFVAQHPALDIAAQGATREQAVERLRLTVKAEREYTLARYGQEFAGIGGRPIFRAPAGRAA